MCIGEKEGTEPGEAQKKNIKDGDNYGKSIEF
jgi:hypothetical protein